MAGRPKKYTKEVIEEIRQKLVAYTEKTDVPIIAEFAYQNNIPRQKLYEFASRDELFNDTIKSCTDKKEAQLERLSLDNKINHRMAIFSLKQLGWKDRQEIDQNNTGELTINIKKAK